jgi:hypothetical protein
MSNIIFGMHQSFARDRLVKGRDADENSKDYSKRERGSLL